MLSTPVAIPSLWEWLRPWVTRKPTMYLALNKVPQDLSMPESHTQERALQCHLHCCPSLLSPYACSACDLFGSLCLSFKLLWDSLDMLLLRMILSVEHRSRTGFSNSEKLFLRLLHSFATESSALYCVMFNQWFHLLISFKRIR